MRFVCDSTVGKLARLLRMAGFDTAYVKVESMAKVLALSKEEGRIILTRNSTFLSLQMASDVYGLQQDEPVEQFRRVALNLKLQIDSKLFLTRCVECNSPLETVDKEVIRERLHDFVARTQEHIRICRHCDKLYWHATHAQAMIKRLLEIKSELDQMSDRPQSSDSD